MTSYNLLKKHIKILIPVGVILCVIISHVLYVVLSHRLRYREYVHGYIVYDENFYVPENKQACKNLVKTHYNIPHFYVEKELDAVTAGRALYIPPIVFIDDGLVGVGYITTYVHELMHIKYQTKNERFVTFQTFKTMYESGDETLRGCAMDLAYMVVCGGYEKEYDCGYYILEYLEKINE